MSMPGLSSSRHRGPKGFALSIQTANGGNSVLHIQENPDKGVNRLSMASVLFGDTY